jgi:peptidoglycan/xylan/chitin deacetylase (PgdA/CDA1 family)
MTAVTFDDISVRIEISEFKRLIAFLDERRIRSTLFVTPRRGAPAFDESFGKVLRLAISSGHEIALHGYSHVKNEFGYTLFAQLFSFPFPRYQQQKTLIERGTKCLEALTKERPIGFRAPYYRLNNATLTVLKDLGYIYDSSRTVFMSSRLSYFRLRTFYPPKPIRKKGIIEIPITGDYTFGLGGQVCSKSHRFALWKAMQDFNWAREVGGVFVLNIHPYLRRFDYVFTFLDALVQRIQKKTEFVPAKDLLLA